MVRAGAVRGAADGGVRVPRAVVRRGGGVADREMRVPEGHPVSGPPLRGASPAVASDPAAPRKAGRSL